MPGDVRLLSTASTPPYRTPAKAVLRESSTALHPPTPRRMTRFPLLAVPTTLAPQLLSICIAAMPTPPPRACTNIVSPAWMAATWSAACAVMHTVGSAAPSWGLRLGGRGAQVAAGASTTMPSAPGAKPKTLVPGGGMVPGPAARTIPA